MDGSDRNIKWIKKIVKIKMFIRSTFLFIQCRIDLCIIGGQILFWWWYQMFGEILRQFMAFQLQIDQIIGQCEFISIQKTVLKIHKIYSKWKFKFVLCPHRPISIFCRALNWAISTLSCALWQCDLFKIVQFKIIFWIFKPEILPSIGCNWWNCSSYL